MSDRGFDSAASFRLLPSGETGTRACRPATPSHCLFRQDAVEWLSSLADGSVDLVVTDPAYESLEKYRAVGTTTRLKHSKSSSNDWFQIFPNSRFPELFRELHRVMRKHTHLYLFCDQATMFVAKPIAEAGRLQVLEGPDVGQEPASAWATTTGRATR